MAVQTLGRPIRVLVGSMFLHFRGTVDDTSSTRYFASRSGCGPSGNYSLSNMSLGVLLN